MGVNVERGNWGESDVTLRCETLHWKGSLDGATQYMPVRVGELGGERVRLCGVSHLSDACVQCRATCEMLKFRLRVVCASGSSPRGGFQSHGVGGMPHAR